MVVTTFSRWVGIPLAFSLALICCGRVNSDDIGSGGSGATEGAGGGTENGTGGESDDCAWSKAPEVTCEEFEGSPPETLILGARQSERCVTFDWIEDSLALRGIDFDADEAQKATPGGDSNGCPASSLLFPEGITYGGGCGPFPFLLCDGRPEREGERCCYPVLEATFSGCCG